ncbi:MAG: tRNA pseudouridine(55) synthase TruB [Acidimicrobiia bacterium]|nr:tRNA pseudouridine(55) synthase TruB [Acidimicrobiia bacterium]
MGRGRSDGPDGLAVLDKAAGWTSHDVVAKARGLLGTRRVGHAGTLDPDATGVLLLGAGRVTRLLRFLTALGKAYEGEVVLGTATSTLDAAGEVTGTWDMGRVTAAEVAAAAAGFVGEIDQVPPMVSAVKVGGRRLHELARQGLEVEREARRVTVGRFELAPTGDPLVYRASVECSSGTYVRSLAADLGEALGGGAHLRNLRRLAVGSFDVAEALGIEGLSPESLLSPADALRDYPAVQVGPQSALALGRGQRLDAAAFEPGGPGQADQGPWRALDEEGRLVAVVERSGDALRPVVVLAPAPAR